MAIINFSNVKIYDCFTFFNEIELLKFRLEYLYDHVEKFVISEADITFSGNKKGFNFWENRADFSRWINKIEYIKYKPSIEHLNFNKPDHHDPNFDAWKVEKGQRDILYQPLISLGDDSLIMLTDLDEIWNPALIRGMNSQEFGAARLEMSLHYYFMNCRGFGIRNKTWTLPFCITSNLMKVEKNAGFSKIRDKGQMPVIENAGWHFSYLGGTESIINKIESFSHQELNTEEIKNVNRIARCINLGLDPYDRQDHEWAFVHIDSFPAELASLMRKYPEFLKVNLL